MTTKLPHGRNPTVLSTVLKTFQKYLFSTVLPLHFRLSVATLEVGYLVLTCSCFWIMWKFLKERNLQSSPSFQRDFISLASLEKLWGQGHFTLETLILLNI